MKKELEVLVDKLIVKFNETSRLRGYSGSNKVFFELFQDVILILRRLIAEIKKKNSLQLEFQHNYGNTSGKIFGSVKKLIISQEQTDKFLELDLKTLFHYFYIMSDHIYKDFSKEGNIWIREYRNLNLVHIFEKMKKVSGIKDLTKSASFYTKSFDYQLYYINFSFYEDDEGFKKIAEQLSEFLPEIANEKINKLDKIKLIWSNLGKLPKAKTDQEKKEMKSFLDNLMRFGILSPPITLIVKELSGMLDEFDKN